MNRKGLRVLITAGPTREHLDPIRFLTNASSGAMGVALAHEARRQGARVVLVLGPLSVPPPRGRGLRVIPVTTALQMLRRTLPEARRADVVIGAAAVGDWRFARPAASKVKRSASPLRVTLVPNPDILAELGRRRRGRARPVLVGFALETERGISNARAKLRRKGLDLVVANGPATLSGTRIRMSLVGPDGPARRCAPMSKPRAAREILRAVGALLGAR